MEKLGKQGFDKVSGFSGTITAKAVYLYSGVTYCIEGKVYDPQKSGEIMWFDEKRVVLYDEKVSDKA